MADDDLVVLKAFEMRLKAEGFVVTTTADPANVASMAQTERADLIILDVNFPSNGAMDWSGFSVVKWLKRFPEFERMPIILISASDAAQLKEHANAVGAIGLLQKPIRFEDLLRTIFDALGREFKSPL